MVRIMKDSNEYEFYLEGKKEAQKVMIGEYLKQKDFVIAKFPQGSSIFDVFFFNKLKFNFLNI